MEWSAEFNTGFIYVNKKTRYHLLKPCLIRNNFKNLNFPVALLDTECEIVSKERIPKIFKTPVTNDFIIINKPSIYPIKVLFIHFVGYWER